MLYLLLIYLFFSLNQMFLETLVVILYSEKLKSEQKSNQRPT